MPSKMAMVAKRVVILIARLLGSGVAYRSARNAPKRIVKAFIELVLNEEKPAMFSKAVVRWDIFWSLAFG